MLSFAPSSSPHNFLPPVPSPLSPRSANIYGPPARHHSMATSDESAKPNSNNAPGSENIFTFDRSHIVPSAMTKTMRVGGNGNLPYSQRNIKKAPTTKPSEMKDRRRNAFLRKVQNTREDERFERRGEDIMRLEFARQRKMYEEELARNAPSIPADDVPEEEEYELPSWTHPKSSANAMDLSSQQASAPEEEVEEFVRDEEEEMRALLDYLPESGEGEKMDESDGNLWSDDADYDALFSEVLESENAVQQQGQGQVHGQGRGNDGDVEMDMS